MEITTTTINRNQGRRAAVNALALVGFIVLIIMGIALAIYGVRLIPSLANRLGAAVSLSSIFKGSDDAELNVVQTATSTLPVEVPGILPIETPSSSNDDGDTKDTGGSKNTTGGTTGTYTVVTTTNSPIAPYGDPDLKVTITDTGYLRSDDTDSFVSSNSVPDGKRGAFKFTVTNIGTNVSGSWEFEAKVPTTPSYTYSSSKQRSLKPGDRIDFVLGFTKPKSGSDRTITVTVDPDRNISESNEGNNTDSEEVDIRD